jgi:orotate phosphoribosyltransferase
LVVEDVLVVIDREESGAAALAAAGLRLHSVMKVRTLLDHLRAARAASAADIDRAVAFLATTAR